MSIQLMAAIATLVVSLATLFIWGVMQIARPLQKIAAAVPERRY